MGSLNAVPKKSDQVLMSNMTNSLHFNPELLLSLSSMKEILLYIRPNYDASDINI